MTAAPAIDPAGTMADFAGLLKIEQIGEDHFIARHSQNVYRHLYGGQIMAQALHAAQLTVSDRAPHSYQAVFQRPGDPARPLEFAIEREMDGRSIALRRVVASQDGKRLLTLNASFHAAGPGFAHQSPMPDVPGPDELPDEMETIRAQGREVSERTILSIAARPYEVRMPVFARDIAAKAHGGPDYQWFRARAPLGDDPAHHRALITYVADYQLLGKAMRMHGIAYFAGNGGVTSLNHAQWFHQPEARADEWLLYVVDTPWAAGGRALGHGAIYSRDGVLVATASQEGLIWKA